MSKELEKPVQENSEEVTNEEYEALFGPQRELQEQEETEEEPTKKEEPTKRIIEKEQVEERTRKKIIYKTDYIFKEIPLFKYEWVLYLVLTLASTILILLAIIGIYEGGFIAAAGIPIVLMWTVYLAKDRFYLPRGNKKIVMKVHSNSNISFTVQDLKDRVIHFDKNDEIPPTQVTRENRHTELSTGKPLVIAFEGHTENLSINELMSDERQERSAQELNRIVKSALITGYQLASSAGKVKDKLQEYAPMLGVATFLIALFTLFLVYQLSNDFKEIGTMLELLKETVTSLNGVVASMGSGTVVSGP